AWMGRAVFLLFDKWGGAPLVATALVVMSAVPAAYQFGLWDSTAQNRCKRLELLLLSELSGWDYFHASLSAAWKRAREYRGLAALVPTAAAFVPLKTGVTWAWAAGFALTAAAAGAIAGRALARCEADLRAWYDANHGRKSVE